MGGGATAWVAPLDPPLMVSVRHKMVWEKIPEWYGFLCTTYIDSGAYEVFIPFQNVSKSLGNPPYYDFSLLRLQHISTTHRSRGLILLNKFLNVSHIDGPSDFLAPTS
jgi:hypothetical protein